MSCSKLRFAAITILAVLLSACGGAVREQDSSSQLDAADPPADTASQPGPVAGRAVPDARPADGFAAQAGLAGLASPAELLAVLEEAEGHSASFTQAEGHKDGAQYEDLLPNNNVTVGGSALSFDPDFPPGSLGLNGLAYAIWDFSLPNHQAGILGSLNWGLNPSLPNLYLGVGNFAENRWDWVIPTEITALNLSSATPYFSPTDHFLLCIAITGTQSASLTEIQLEGVEPPIASLDADVASGLIPLDVNFDGSASSDPDGSIVSYEWDFDGDGTYGETGDEADNADNPDPPVVTYSTAGSFDAALRVTDDDGASAVAVVTITTNIAPTVQLEADVTAGNQPLLVTFTATPADANGSIVTIEWDLDGNGSFNELPAEQAASGDATPLPYQYTNPGSFDVKVRVFDNHGAEAQDSINIQVGAPPQVDLNADDTSGPKPHTVTFTADATDPGGSIDDVEWDYDGDGVFNENGNGEAGARGDLTPAPKTYVTTGERDPVVRVTDNDGGTATDTIHITVTNTPPNAALDASPGTGGDAPFDVTFDASASADPGGAISNYEWDFDGDNIYNEAGDEATAEGDSTPATYTYTDPGSFIARVRVTDDDGATDVATLNIVAHGWVVITITTPSGGIFAALGEIGGHPAIAYRDNSSTGLYYGYSSTPDGTDPADWTLVQVDSEGNTGWRSVLLEVAGQPAVFYHSQSSGSVKYARANTATGDTAASWTGGTQLTLDTASNAYLGLSMAIVAGNPAVAYFRGDDTTLHYRRSATASGSDAAAWSTGANLTLDGDVGTISAGEHCSLAVISGNPAIAFKREDTNLGTIWLRYKRASTADGAALIDWTGGATVDISSTESPAYIALLSAGGNPALAYQESISGDLVYRRSADTLGDALADWTGGSNFDLDTTNTAGNYTNLASLGGSPSVIHVRDTGSREIRFLLANNSSGAAIGDWTTDEPADSGASPLGEWITYAVVDGRPSIVYRGATASYIKYATRF